MIYLFFILWAKLAGEVEAFLYSQKGAYALEQNEHKWFVWQRISFGLMALAGGLYVWLLGFPLALLIGAAEGLGAALAFSFFRDGFYNIMRARIGKRYTPDWQSRWFYWRYTSLTDTSELNFAWHSRWRMFLASVFLLLGSHLVLYFLLR